MSPFLQIHPAESHPVAHVRAPHLSPIGFLTKPLQIFPIEHRPTDEHLKPYHRRGCHSCPLILQIHPAESHPVAHVRALHLKAAVAAQPEECLGLLQGASGRMARLEESCGSAGAAWALADSHALLALHHAQQALVLPGKHRPELQLTFVQEESVSLIRISES